MSEAETGKRKRGFARLSPEERSALAKRAGKRAHELGRAHVFNPEEARAAGSMGGRVAVESGQLAAAASAGGRSVVELYGVEHMRAIGRTGGNVSKRVRGKGERATRGPVVAPARQGES